MDEEMSRIVKCKYCGKYEYFGRMTWLSGKCMCRACYKKEFEKTYSLPYLFDDRDGPAPSEEDFMNQEDDICDNCGRYGQQCTGCEHQHVRKEMSNDCRRDS